MRLNSEDPPKSLVAYSLLPGSVTVASGPEVPGIAPMLFELSQSGIAGLVTTGPSAWTSVTALGLSKTNHAWCEDRGGTCNNKESRVTLARCHSSLHIAVISLLPKTSPCKWPSGLYGATNGDESISEKAVWTRCFGAVTIAGPRHSR